MNSLISFYLREIGSKVKILPTESLAIPGKTFLKLFIRSIDEAIIRARWRTKPSSEASPEGGTWTSVVALPSSPCLNSIELSTLTCEANPPCC